LQNRAGKLLSSSKAVLSRRDYAVTPPWESMHDDATIMLALAVPPFLHALALNISISGLTCAGLLDFANQRQQLRSFVFCRLVQSTLRARYADSDNR
jgi:hypothetical protein